MSKGSLGNLFSLIFFYSARALGATSLMSHVDSRVRPVVPPYQSPIGAPGATCSPVCACREMGYDHQCKLNLYINFFHVTL